MSVSEKEEHVAQRHSSDAVAGIPIKKRRFLLDLSASFPAPASSLESEAKDLPKKELSKILHGSSITDNVGLLTSSSGIPLAKESANVDASGEPQSMSNLPVVRTEVPICVSSGSIVDTEMKVKYLLIEENDSQNNLPNEGLSKILCGPCITDNVGLLTSSSGIPLAKESANVDASGEPQSMSNLPVVRTEVPICVSSGSIVDTEMKVKYLLIEENDSQNNLPNEGLSKILCGPCITDNLGLLASSTGICLAKEGAVDASGEYRTMSNFPEAKNEVPTCIPSNSLADEEMKVKNLGTEKNDSQNDFGYTEPYLVKKEAVSLNKVEDTDIASKHKFEGSSDLESSAFAESTELSGRPKEHLFQALAGENIEKPHQMQEKLDHISLNLSLSKGKNIKCQSDSVEAKRNDSDMSANRNKWDLNTTMDDWEDSEVACEGAVADTSFGGTVFDKGTLDIISGKGEFVASLESQGDFERRSNISISSELPSQQCKSDSSLNLCLSPSYHEFAPCQKKFSSPLGFNTSRVLPSTNTPVVVPSTSSLILSDKSIVKSEPVDESSIRVFAETKKNSKLSSDERSLRNETTDISIELVNSCSQPLIVSGSIKSELLEDTNKGIDPVGVKSCILQKHSELFIAEEKLPPSCTSSSSKMVVGSGFVSSSSDRLMGVCNEEVPQEASEKVQLNDSEMTNTCLDQEVEEMDVLDGMVDTKGSSDVTVDSSNESGEIILLEKRENGEGSESVQEPSTYSDATITSQAAMVTVSQGEEESTKVTNSVEKNIVALHKMEKSVSGTDEPKNGSSPGNRSRIISLKAVNISSVTCKTKSIAETGTSSRSGREKYADSGMEGDKYYHPRGRERAYNESHHRFSRDRNHDQPYRNFRMNYRGRGRGSSRPRRNYGDWNEDRDIPEEGYSIRFRISRPRHRGSDDVDDAELDSDSYIPGLDDRMVGPGRGRRRPISDEEIPKFRDFSSRGRSFVSHRVRQMVRRPTRTFSSSSRCIGEDGSTDIVGLRGSDKFTRAMDGSMVDPVFTRPEPYDPSNVHFTRLNKHFGSVQSRADVPRIRSKSPIRSPRQWSSPRRGSPDGFDGHQVLTRRRSATIYRADRLIRPPDRACFHTDTGFRRHKSPPYLDSSQEFVTTTRSIICNRRSPSGRVVQRNNSRFEILDPRERADTDEYFESPLRSSRFQDLGGGEGSGDERRGGAERRRPTRSFRAPEGENFHFTEEDAPPTRPPYRFCPDENSEFSGRTNLRERESERRGKNQSGPAHPPRRMRDNIEDQEGKYSGSGKVWHIDEFDDSIKVKRTRF